MDKAQPEELMQATIYKHRPLIMLTGYSKIDLDGLDDNTKLFELFWTWQKCNLTSEGSMTNLIQVIHNGQAVEVSDGTFKDQAGAAAWMIEGCMAEDRLWGTGLTLGQPEDQSACWSKLFGLWSILASLKQLVASHNIEHGQVTIACDGNGTLKKAQQEHLTEPSEAHYNLISAIQNLQREIPLMLKFEHIKGHQD